MSAITLVNRTDTLGDFRVSQGAILVARVGIAAGGTATIPSANRYSAQALTTLGEFRLMSNTVEFDDTSVTLVACMSEQNGYYRFDLVLAPGVAPNTITLRNEWSSPVQFTLERIGGPSQPQTVDAQGALEIDIAPPWTVYATVDAVTTPIVSLDSDASLALVGDDRNGYRLVVS